MSAGRSGPVLVTGGAGFIGSNLVRLLLAQGDAAVVNVDLLTYAGNPESVADLQGRPGYTFAQADVCDAEAVRRLLQTHRPRAVLHLAAETHVDRSIVGPGAFVQTNLVGTYTLLEEARRYLAGLAGEARQAFRFVAVSTDEVYGSLAPGAAAAEDARYHPSSPYAASKAGADHLVRAYHLTYGLPAIVTNCSNNYGPYQFPEKLIPLFITRALEGEPLPVYGDGGNERDWIHVGDHCAALLAVLRRGRPGRTYNLGADQVVNNLELVGRLCDVLQDLRPPAADPPLPVAHYRELITHVADRPGHDRRYALDAGRARQELGWAPAVDLDAGLRQTVRWYLDNPGWVQRVRSGAYREWVEQNYGQRLRGDGAPPADP